MDRISALAHQATEHPTAVATAIASGLAAPAIASTAVFAIATAMGFHATGIVAGSFAAKLMSSYAGATAAGSVVATLQAAGATGHVAFALGPTLAISGAGGAVGGAAATKWPPQVWAGTVWRKCRRAMSTCTGGDGIVTGGDEPVETEEEDEGVHPSATTTARADRTAAQRPGNAMSGASDGPAAGSTDVPVDDLD
ncbi:hypothetical protein AMAG_01503 [Allomyces macrogynus ATCC 38327]|uniref:Uncharacterized protein n=1 Tax=Allomyces macrogynus (strain ATCC 38327) TaxID=578462 RepID=A0A0L0RZX2_ALLM3|nr:hypothetical protein AMAG_01503 [Allomyces macrogynus ATCC 38327]|eukprot:KNE55614.1 hypothetical protein AMAG_01503 [Allomyces macrogynus ATCC 38327]